jgi:prepilin-type processing-associated H-X9-DG protein
MQTDSPGEDMPRGSGARRIVLRAVLVGVGVCVVVALALWAGTGKTFLRAVAAHQQRTCLSNLRQLGLGCLVYCVDYSGPYPDGRVWSDLTLPYVLSLRMYQCPSLPDSPCGYAYNPALGGRPQEQLRVPDQVAMLFDGKGGWNDSGGEDRVARRHEGFNCAFADGHAELVRGTHKVMWMPR